MVLAHLLGKYGRNVIDPSRITLLHLDHGWRPQSLHEERDGVFELATSLGVGFLHQRLEPPFQQSRSENWEEDARLKRLEVYDSLAGAGKAHQYVLTAHHRDDVVETVLWRFLRGEFSEGEVGIKFLDCQCLRPFLEVSKEQIFQYAREEGVRFFEDASNQDVRRFRAWARSEVLPMLERVYPSVRKTLSAYSNHRFGAEDYGRSEVGMTHEIPNLLQAVVDGPLNRAQRAALAKLIREAPEGRILSLPGGVQLKRLKTGWLIEDSDQGNSS
jgi:tRNA(Ile)-lysidine synthetase-like protein